jgi:hypothetical protein
MENEFESTPQDAIQLTGDQISGGTIANFASTGIKDLSTKQSLVIEDDKITVKSASIDTLDRGVVIKGDVKVYGILDAGFIRTTEIMTNVRHEKQYLEFASPEGDSAGRGLLWAGDQPRQFIFMINPNRFWSTEHIDLPGDKSYHIDGTPVIFRDKLGSNIVNSNLQSVGTLKNLSVAGEVNINDHIFYNPISQRLSLGQDAGNGLFSVYDYTNNVEIIIDSSENGHGRIGTYNNKGLDLVTGDQVCVSINELGHVTVGSEYKDSTVTRIYGKVGVGIKHPKEQLEVAGNLKFGNRLFANGDSAPTEGTYQTGDIVWNSIPRIGMPIGWVCIQTGIPGQWQPFGTIQP